MNDSARTPEEVGRLWFERMWDRRELSLIDELLGKNAIGHLEGGEEVVGPEAFAQFQEEFLEAIPDIRLKVNKLLADNSDVCIHWSATGTHRGSGFGCNATGCPVDFQGVTWLRVKDGVIIEGWDFWNMDRLMRKMSGEAVGV
jgi:steroid delta-isomerase-like uncharacterized protein